MVSVSSFRSDEFALQQCKVRHIVIENVRNRLQPITITFSGLSGDLEAFVSQKFKFPSESQNNGAYINTNTITFATENLKPQTGPGDDEPVYLPRFRCNQIYLSVETTQASSQVTISVKYGQGAGKATRRRKDDEHSQGAVSPTAAGPAAEEILLGLGVGLENKVADR